MTTLEQHVQHCFTLFGTPTATKPCGSECAAVVERPVSNDIVPVWFCPAHRRVWENPDGAAHDPDVLERARRFYNINTTITDHTNQEGLETCHGACHAVSLSHTLAGEGRWRPPQACVVYCPDHHYLHACRGDETPCNNCHACAHNGWCIYRCISNWKSEARKGEPVCIWSGRILSNVDAPTTKASKQQESFTSKKTEPAAVKQVRRRSSACSETYIKNWLSACASKPHVEFRDIPEFIGSWQAVSEEWPATLHIAGWAFLLSSHYGGDSSTKTLLGVRVPEHRRAWIDALASTPFGKKSPAACADAIVCHLMQNPIRDFVLRNIQSMSLFESAAPPRPRIAKKK